LLEQNAVPGRATRWLARRANAVCLAMEQARRALPGRAPVFVTGNPIRTGFEEPLTHRNRLLILGGSGGAQALNQAVPKALYRLRSQLGEWRVVHQTGSAGFEVTCQLYRKLAIEATLVDFVADMPGMLAATGMCVCRSGGTTLAELAVAGVPALLLPYPDAADDHQRHNAEVFTAGGGTLTLDERELGENLVGRLAETLREFLSNPGRRTRMSLALRRLARPGAAEQVATLLRSVVSGESPDAALPPAA
jgi:UDP-N-acetylglucosamine--N-acetylmuramyl-(pentapeptide) pyrophosphoryl-undecaprenol N-acetylglucosamine transferase